MLQPNRPAKPSPRDVWLCPKCKEPMVLAIIKFGDTGELEERARMQALRYCPEINRKE